MDEILSGADQEDSDSDDSDEDQVLIAQEHPMIPEGAAILPF